MVSEVTLDDILKSKDLELEHNEVFVFLGLGYFLSIIFSRSIHLFWNADVREAERIEIEFFISVKL